MGTQRQIIHVDMDAFYASVEERDDPSLRGKPLIVGGDRRRGVVLAASYAVRPFGVRSAMPMRRAMELAPNAVIVPPRPGAYAEASATVFDIFARYTPLIEPLSLDEAFMDVTASVELFGSASEMARQIRAAILSEVHLPASAGIAKNKLIAKIASDSAKPNGQLEIPAEDSERFLAPLPIGRLFGVGPKLETRLRALGIQTLGDLTRRSPESVEVLLGEGGRELHARARGEDDRPVQPDRAAKSIGAEDTFARDLRGVEALHPHLHAQALRVARRLRRAGLSARVVALKVKSADFRTLTRRRTLPEATDDGQVIFRVVTELLAALAPTYAVRLVGVQLAGLEHTAQQLSIFEAKNEKSRRLNQTLDEIAFRFGVAAISTADLGTPRAGWDESQDEARRRMGAAQTDVTPPTGSKKPR